MAKSQLIRYNDVAKFLLLLQSQFKILDDYWSKIQYLMPVLPCLSILHCIVNTKKFTNI